MRGALHAQRLAHKAVHLVNVAGSTGQVGEARIDPQIVTLDGVQKTLPVAVVVDQRADVAVAGFVGSAPGRQQPHIAGVTTGRLESEPVEVVRQHHAGHGFEHRHVNAAAASGALAPVQRHGHAVRCMQADHAVGNRQRHVARLARPALLLQGGDADRALDQVVIGRAAGVGTVLAVTVHAAPDDAWIDHRDALVVQPEPGDGGRAEVVHEDIGAFDQAPHRSRALRRFEVKRHAALVAVQVQEQRTHAGMASGADPACRVALRGFNLDHVRAMVAKDLGGVGPHQHRAEVDHPHALEWPGGCCLLVLACHLCLL
ncbi:hypothetical protein Y695_01560 [Hydrogenophaga sp. T4]|nr:hypothetical protein Y695_01560 [Hydrogenophaga sp. T4]